MIDHKQEDIHTKQPQQCQAPQAAAKPALGSPLQERSFCLHCIHREMCYAPNDTNESISKGILQLRAFHKIILVRSTYKLLHGSCNILLQITENTNYRQFKKNISTDRSTY